ncbi:SseB family protein [Nonomuraea sp. NPDC049486]|uniref:SseB family protein n=1 Tax=Nonomuraea sp. NPDC049486 TaxID=3155773 RepID=UPI003418A7F3
MGDLPPPWGWRRVVWSLLYTVQFKPVWDDDLVRWRAGGLVLEPFGGFTREEEYEALQEALDSGERLLDLLPDPPVPHDEQDIRDFLRRVLEHMDLLRPWPELPFLVMRHDPSPDLGDFRAIARLHLDGQEAAHRLHGAFYGFAGGGSWQPMRLNSGDEVALVEPWWQGSRDVAVLARPSPGRAPEDVLAAFLHVTGFVPEEIDDLTDGLNAASRGGAGSGWLAYLLRLENSIATLAGEEPVRVSRSTYEAFLRTRLYCQATESPGVVAVGPPGAGLVPAFTLPEALAAFAAAGKDETEPRFFSATGRDLLDLIPEGYGVLVDPGTAYATAFAAGGPG